MTTEKDVLSVINQAVQRIEMSLAPPLSKVLFRDWAILWLETWRKNSVTDISYYDTYKRPVDLHLIPYFGDFWLHEITPLQVQQFFNEKATTYSLESLKKMKAPLASIFETGIENNHCAKSPITKTLRLYSKIPDREKFVWSEREYNVAYEFAQCHPKGLGILVLMETALSRSELLALRRQDFSFSGRFLSPDGGIVETRSVQNGKYELQRTEGKNQFRKRRTIPISDNLANRLAAAFNASPYEYLFHSKKGTPLWPHNWHKRDFFPFMRDLHEEHPEVRPLTPHELRHTTATLLAYQGVDLYTVSRLMGHADLKMLQKRYLHDDLEAMRNALGR